MIHLRYSILVSLLIFLWQPLSARSLDDLIAKTPNILFGEIYNVGPTYLLVEVAWELKGKVKSEVISIEIAREWDHASNYKKGDQLLVFMARNVQKPLQDLPLADLRLSRFDEFEGQTAFMKILIDSDYKKLSEIDNRIHGKEFAALSY